VQVTRKKWMELASAAWATAPHAYLYGTTHVGAAVMSAEGNVFVGCNIEHRFRSHDIHAEVNAISSMVAGGYPHLIAVMVVAKRRRFTPCGACLDWILELGGPKCAVGFQSAKGHRIRVYDASDLMPHYPI